MAAQPKMGEVSDNREIFVCDTLESLSQKAADVLTSEAVAAAKSGQKFSLALSGGATPKRLYSLLSIEPHLSTLPWKSIHFFWGDERCVPPTHEESNYHMAREALFVKAPVPATNIHRMKGELEPPSAAQAYEEDLRGYFGRSRPFPEFDFILLGVGEDGHTASLFPRSETLREGKSWVVGTYVEEKKMYRLTLTLPVINHAKRILFLVSGGEKAEIASRLLAGNSNASSFPAGMVRPEHGKTIWVLDSTAAKFVRPL